MENIEQRMLGIQPKDKNKPPNYREKGPIPRLKPDQVIGVYKVIKPLHWIKHSGKRQWIYEVICTACGAKHERFQNSMKPETKACIKCRIPTNKKDPSKKVEVKEEEVKEIPDFITMKMR